MKFRVEVVCIRDGGKSTAAMRWKWSVALVSAVSRSAECRGLTPDLEADSSLYNPTHWRIPDPLAPVRFSGFARNFMLSMFY
jgi:hypothetical protein